MKKVLKFIFMPIGLLFKHLFLIINWLLDNSIGILFTKEYRSYLGEYSEKYKNWEIAKKVITVSLILVMIFSFEFIYQNTIGIVIAKIFYLIGRFFALNIFGDTFIKLSRILLEFNHAYANGIGTTLYLSLIGTTVGLMVAAVFSYIVVMKISRNANKLDRKSTRLNSSHVRIS